MKCSAVAKSTGNPCRRDATVGERCALHVPRLPEVTADGDRRRSLEALRQVIAEAIDADPPARDLAALSNRMLQVLAELDALNDGAEVDVDEVAARRREKLAAASGS